VPRLFVDIVKLPLKPPPLCVAWLDEADAVLKAIPQLMPIQVQTMRELRSHVGQMFLTIVPCPVYLLSLLSFH
jgi:hypothetical protein